MAITLTGIVEISVGDTDNGGVDFTGELDSAETIAAVNSVTEVTSSDLTITGAAVNASAVTIKGESVAIGKAVLFTVSGQLAAGGEDSAGTYRLRINFTTSDGDIYNRDVRMKAV